MRKIYLNYNEFELGFLEEKNGLFVWTPNLDQIQEFALFYDGAIDSFMLDKTCQNTYSSVPYHYSEFLEYAERDDIAEKAGIKSNDSDFEILCKMAKLNYLNQQFVIKLK